MFKHNNELTEKEITEIWFSIWIRDFYVLITLVAIWLCAGCSMAYTEKGEKVKVFKMIKDEMEIVTIEGCEYLKMRTHNGWYCYSHKGNCTNNIHVYRKAE